MKLKEKVGKVISKESLIKLAIKIENSKVATIVGNTISKVPVLKKLNQLSLKKQRMVYTSVFLVVVIGATTAISGFFMGDAEALTYTEYKVEKGDVSVTISGSGTVEPIEQYNVVSLVEGDVLEDTFKEGDTVSKGALLYKIDSSDMEKTLEKADISYEKSAMNYADSQEAYSGLNVTSPIEGRVTEILVQKGDNVSTGTKIATVVDDTYLTAKVSFGTSDIDSLYVGQKVNATVENTFEVLSGTISKIYSSKRVIDGYIEVTDVEVTLKNPGALENGTYVTVNAGGIDSYDGAALEGNTEKIVTAKTSGLVTKIVASEGEYLNRGSEIVRLSSDSAGDSLKNSELSLRESQLSYESTQEQLDEYSITAPISGSVIQKNVKAGDTLEKSSDASSTVLAVIADMSTMTFTIDVDELDIANMKEGQEVQITADALSDQKFTGTVDNIGLLGTSTDGVTTYPVTILINQADGLWPGMNVTAEIVVESAQDVLKIPVSAVNRGNTVLVKGAKGTEGIEQTDAPDGAKYVQIELGLNDESYIEVSKGLSEGDIVMVPVVKASGTSDTSSSNQMMGGGAMGGGGMSGPPPDAGGGGGGNSGNSGSKSGN